MVQLSEHPTVKQFYENGASRPLGASPGKIRIKGPIRLLRAFGRCFPS
jgi:hypothetical protein